MRKEAFRAWLAADHSAKATTNRVSRAGRVERGLSALRLPFADLDEAYDADGLASVLEALRDCATAARAGDRPPEPLVRNSNQPEKQLQSLMNAVQNYRRFRDDETDVRNPSWPALEAMRRIFLDRAPDFVDFAQNHGIYWEMERRYKEAMLEKAKAVLQSDADETAAGHAIIDVLLPQDGPPLRWQTIDAIRKSAAELVPQFHAVVGRLARSRVSITDAITRAAQELEDLRGRGVAGLTPGEIPSIAFNVAAVSRPEEAAFFKISKARALVRRLGGDALFSNKTIEIGDIESWLGLLHRIFAVMRDEWRWKPRDLIDVQSFAWAVLDEKWNALDDEDETEDSVEPDDEKAQPNPRQAPQNLILYGPPGTGKTYATVAEAVRLCDRLRIDDGLLTDPDRREELKARYDELVGARRVDFVTFHQSYSYEEFVEGLRPTQGDADVEGTGSGGAGFSLRPEDGVFRRMARRAAASRGGGGHYAVGDRRIFKLSIGEAANPEDDYLFEEAIAEGHALLGYGDIDWSDARFDERDAFIEACLAYDREYPDNGRPAPTPQTGRVQCPMIFRNWIKQGDLVVVSKGNSKFRAIGEVIGDYEYVPRPTGVYSHRRKVKWLWIDKSGAAVEDIYAKSFSMRSVYLMTRSDVSIPALEAYINSQQSDGRSAEPEPYVLVIDEINRGNISKIFGELITLIEPDKRTGEANAIELRLPYSREPFSVPANLNILGTMNTADRSIALLDTALRRRFVFRELAPDASLLPETVEGVPLRQVLEVINDRIEYLVDREHRIGHAFFIGDSSRDRAAIDATMRDKVIPLLQEYFFEDWARVAAVLGERPGRGGAFLECRKLRDPTGGEGEERESWSVRRDFAPDAYDQLIGKVPAAANAASEEISE